MDQSTTRRLLTTAELADRLQVSQRTLEAWRQRGGGAKYIRLARDGGRVRAVRYRQADVDDWLAERTVASTSDPGGGDAR